MFNNHAAVDSKIFFYSCKGAGSAGICKFLFGVTPLAGTAAKLQFVDPIADALPLLIIATIVVSIMTEPPAEEPRTPGGGKAKLMRINCLIQCIE